ncbi:MAG: hypothetical protein DSY82_07415, partial [Flavobacteriia bacterium]
LLEYLEPISAHVVEALNIFEDFFIGVTDVVGGDSFEHRKRLEVINEKVIKKIKEKVYLMGGNCIIGLRIDNNQISAKNNSLLMVTAIGTPAFADFKNNSSNYSLVLKLKRFKKEINSLSRLEINTISFLIDIKKKYNFKKEQYDLLDEIIAVRKRYFDLKELEEDDLPTFISNNNKLLNDFNFLQKRVKDDEMIIFLKKSNEIKIIKKEEHLLNKELHLSSAYNVLLKNLKQDKL